MGLSQKPLRVHNKKKQKKNKSSWTDADCALVSSTSSVIHVLMRDVNHRSNQTVDFLYESVYWRWTAPSVRFLFEVKMCVTGQKHHDSHDTCDVSWHCFVFKCHISHSFACYCDLKGRKQCF